MGELFEIKPRVEVSESEYKRLLGYPKEFNLEGRARELAENTRLWYKKNGNPWIYAIQADEMDYSNEKLRIDGTNLVSKKYMKDLKHADAFSAFLVIVSAGEECEKKAHQFWIEGKPDEYFFMEIYGSAVVEYLIACAGERLCKWAEEKNQFILPHYSPGYPGWEVKDQLQLFNLIKRRSKNTLPKVINVLETGMIYPKKSMIAVFGISNSSGVAKNFKELIPCQYCSMLSCKFRRLPYETPRSYGEYIPKSFGFNKKNN
ncbi:MAG: hypothetical protein HXY50_02730 [Ignavibacteriaceae bacterium]|nr:hypothetical protein [Ignavibacteriaceae bacterium]